MEIFVTISIHAKERSLDRYGFNENTLLLLAQKAVMNGFSWKDAPCRWVSEYIKSKCEDGKSVYYHNGRIFIFNEHFKLITTYLVPRNVLKGIEGVLKND